MIRTPPLSTGPSIAYREQGAGTPLVQIHGLGTGHGNFDLLSPLLAQAGLRVIDLDLPGYGESDVPTERRTIETYADDVAAFIEALGLAPVAVHGGSMGGLIAQALAARHPEVVDRLVLSCTAGRWDAAAHMLAATWRTAARAGGEALAELTAQQGFSRGFWDRPDAAATLQAFKDALATTTPDEFLRDLETIAVVDLDDAIERITAPTLLIATDEDLMMPLQSAPSGIGMTDLHARIGGSQLVVLEDCGHFVTIERPADTAAAMVAFLSGGR